MAMNEPCANVDDVETFAIPLCGKTNRVFHTSISDGDSTGARTRDSAELFSKCLWCECVVLVAEVEDGSLYVPHIACAIAIGVYTTVSVGSHPLGVGRCAWN